MLPLLHSQNKHQLPSSVLLVVLAKQAVVPHPYLASDHPSSATRVTLRSISWNQPVDCGLGAASAAAGPHGQRCQFGTNQNHKSGIATRLEPLPWMLTISGVASSPA